MHLSLTYLLAELLADDARKEKLMQYDFVTCMLLKSMSIKSSIETITVLLDILLELCSSETLSTTLEKL
jgi:hypothetical protein